MTQDLLLEIGTEELPSKDLIKLVTALAHQLKIGLSKAALTHGETRMFATPRRLAVLISDVAVCQPTRMIEKRGPALSAAFDSNGKPTPACLGFANTCGVSVESLSTLATEKSAHLFFRSEQPGKTAQELLPKIAEQAIAQLPISKPMRWGNHLTSFVRPVRWVVFMLGEQLIPATLLGLNTCQQTYGHRFHHTQALYISHPKAYESLLKEQGYVIADFQKRKQLILKQIEELTLHKGQALISDALLDEVTAIVEWPIALLGEFDASFLEIPSEVIITAMQSHQKYFPLRSKQNDRLLPNFIVISNIAATNPDRIIHGNERVLRARLADAQFFYHSDLKHCLEQRLEVLQKIVFQKKLGTLLEKAQRISALTGHLARDTSINPEQAKRAGLLAKADLACAMVGEFPELQGMMGGYYAQHDAEPGDIPAAIREHYQPKFSGDHIPHTSLGCLVAVADKMDTLVGLFGVGQPPTGEKDPFALRRGAIGVLRILIEKELPFDLVALIQKSIELYEDRINSSNLVHEVFDFMMERLRAWYLDRGISAEIFNAVLARLPTQPLDFHWRIQAVQHFLTLPEAEALTSANKRVSQILKKQQGEWQHHPLNPTLLTHLAEKQLLEQMEQKNKVIEIFCHQSQYTQLLTTLAELRAPIDQFFDEVMVMVDDEKIRYNRLALLYQLQQLFLKVADISML